jgi:hypothetical protein
MEDEATVESHDYKLMNSPFFLKDKRVTSHIDIESTIG